MSGEITDQTTYDITEYLLCETRSFEEIPFNEVDALILAELSYCRFDDLVPALEDGGGWVRLDLLTDDASLTAMTYGQSSREKKRLLIERTAKSPRFAGIALNYFTRSTDDLMEKQFSAVSFRLPDKTVFIAYRGTDNSLTGWRENFNMAYLDTVPAQHSSLRYFNRVAELCHSIMPWKSVKGFRLGGHSKGGNLAIYAAVNCTVALKARILGAYSFDGPGFKRNIFEQSDYTGIREHVHLYLPQDSMIGTLLIQSDDYDVIRSTGTGFAQHDPFTWQIHGDSFVREADLTPRAKMMNDVLDRWMDSVEDSKRSLLIRTVFEIVEGTDAQNFSDVMKLVTKRDWGALRTLKNVPADERRDLFRILMSLLRTYREISKQTKDSQEKPDKSDKPDKK